MNEGRLVVRSIGAGYFARLHLAAWHQMADVALAGVADLDPARAAEALRDIAGEGHGIAIFDSAEALLAAGPADIVDIAVPPGAHFDLIRLALAAQPRVVICQKPFCASPEEADEAVALADAAGVALVVHENFRFQPWYRAMREAIADGEIGTPYQITMRLRPGDGQGERAYLDRQPYFRAMPRFLIHETGIHFIDTFRFLFGEPDAVYADLRQLNPGIGGEDAGLMILRYADGRRAVLDGNRLADHAAQNPRLTMGECRVEGSGGTLDLDGFGRLHLRRFGHTEAERLGDWSASEGFGGGCVAALQAHVVRHLKAGAPLENTAAAYRANQRLEEAVYRSAAEGTVVRL